MTKKEIIQTINKITRDAGMEHCGVIQTNRSKFEFVRLYGVAIELVIIYKDCKQLEEKFELVEIANALMDGTNNSELNKILNYRKQISELSEEIGLG